MAKQAIFRREPDYFAFLDCLGRHLGPAPSTDSRGRPYVWLGESVTLASYGLISNHYHLLARDQSEDGSALRALIQSSQTGYAKYFNRKYERNGPLYQSSFHAKEVSSLEQLQETISYVHLNFDDDPRYRHCSHKYWTREIPPIWLDPWPALEAIGGPRGYDMSMVRKLKKRSRVQVSEIMSALADAEQKLARERARRFADATLRASEMAVLQVRRQLEQADAYRDLIANAKTLDEILTIRDFFHHKAGETASSAV